MLLPNGQEVSGFMVFWGYVMLFWFITTSVWLWRNPTANIMTCYSRFDHVIKWEKLSEFQVKDSH